MAETCPQCGYLLKPARLVQQLRERALWLENNYPARATVELLRRAADEIAWLEKRLSEMEETSDEKETETSQAASPGGRVG